MRVHKPYAPVSPRPGKDHCQLSNGHHIWTRQSPAGKSLVRARKRACDTERRNIFHSSQGGYRAVKSTMENAARFAYDVFEGFQRKQHTPAVAVHLEDAPSRVQFKLPISFLVQYCRLNAHKMDCSSTPDEKGRDVAWELDLHSPTTHNGTPQGSPLSPALYNVYVEGPAGLNSSRLTRVLTVADEGHMYKAVRDTTQQVPLSRQEHL